MTTFPFARLAELIVADEFELPDATALRSPFGGGQQITSVAVLQGLRCFLPNLSAEEGEQVRRWLAIGRRSEVTMPYPQHDRDTVFAPANFTINATAGRALTLASAPAAGTTRPGRMCAVSVGGRRYCHVVEAVSGATLTLASVPRLTSYNGGFVELGQCSIQGFISDVGKGRTDDGISAPISWTITEAR